MPSPRGRRIDVARTAREARRTAGETLRLFRKVRPEKPRRILLLVDVSGSMKAHSETTLRFAQLLTRTRPKVETFCFGTRLSRVTATLKHRLPDEALARLSELVFDFDGGTQIGASLEDLPVGLALCSTGARRRHAGLFGRARTWRAGLR